MFKIQAKKCFKIRKTLIHAYQEQGSCQDVIFKCKDGEQRCSRLALQFMSDFYLEQLQGRDRMGNEPVFNYDYPKRIIKYFLDIMHSISVELNLVDLVLLIKFLKFEAKSDASEFESTLLKMLTDELKKADNVTVATKLLINHVCNSFDSFHGFFEQAFFGQHTQTELIGMLEKIDWATEENKQLKQLITDEKYDENVNCETEAQMYMMIKMMKKKNLTKKIDKGKRVQITFYDYHWPKVQFDFEVNTSHTTRQLIDQLKFHNYDVTSLWYKNKRMERSLGKYNLQDGDIIKIS